MLSRPTSKSCSVIKRSTIQRHNLSTTSQTRNRSIVNQIYQPQSKPIPALNPSTAKSTLSYPDIHKQSEWDDNLVNESLNDHCLMAW